MASGISIVFERGVEFSSRPNSMKVDPSVTTLGAVIARARHKYDVRPVLLKECLTTNTPVSSITENWRLFSREGAPSLDLDWSAQLIGPPFAPTVLRHQYKLAYTVGAVIHHCKRLADIYSGIALDMLRIASIPGHADAPFVSYGYQLEPYYELDAILAAGRRAYDASRYLLWDAFGTKKGSLPSNFPKTLRACIKLPPQLREVLEMSWQAYGERLTDYRDCIIHYAPVDFGRGTASMHRLDDGVWSVLMRIPDNPEAKSEAAFTFAKGLDALTYAWELTCEIARVAKAIMATIPDSNAVPANLPLVVVVPASSNSGDAQSSESMPDNSEGNVFD